MTARRPGPHRSSPRHRGLLSWCLLVVVMGIPLQADDWPQWRGPLRDGQWRESGIRQSLPSDGLPARWRTEIGGGYSGPAVADGRVYLMDYLSDADDVANNPSQRTELAGRERVLCLDAADGKILWTHQYECPYAISYACGPRCTPTVFDGMVYTLGAEGHLHCLDAITGKPIWAKDFKKDYGATTPIWGFSNHPLIDGDRLVCMVGGEGSVVVAFDRHTGAEVWRGLSASETGYAPPSFLESDGGRQLLIWDADTISVLEPATGKTIWAVPLKPGFGMSIMAPQVADTSFGKVMFASGIGNIGALFKLTPGQPGATLLWGNRPKASIASANSTPAIVGDVLYGCDCETGFLTAVDLATGERLWETGVPTLGSRRGRHGTAFLVRQGEFHWLFSETGDLILARLRPTGYEELGRIHLLDPTGECFGREVVWSHPAFAAGCVFARNDREIVCVSLAEQP